MNPAACNEVALDLARAQLRAMNAPRCRAPADKLACVERSCGVIFSMLNLSRAADGDDDDRPGADDFLPVFIYTVLHARVPRLYSTCEYIQAYANPQDLMSRAGYCFVTLRSAVEFLLTLDSSCLSGGEAAWGTPDEFAARLAQAEAAVDAGELE